MKFSMNGFRQQLSNDVNDLKNIIESIEKGEFYDSEDLVDSINTLVTHSNVINCVYHKDDPDFKDMSELEIEHIER